MPAESPAMPHILCADEACTLAQAGCFTQLCLLLVLMFCSSYHKYKAEKEGGVTPDSGEAPSGGSTSSGSDVASNVKEGAAAAADKASEVKDQAGAKASQLADKASEVKDQAAAKASQLADKAGAAAQGAVDSAKGLAQEAKDTARATGRCEWGPAGSSIITAAKLGNRISGDMMFHAEVERAHMHQCVSTCFRDAVLFCR